MNRTIPVYSHNPYDQDGFPLLILTVQNRVCSPPNEGFRTLHWHNEVQFICLFEGSIQAQIHQESLCLHAGECLFINRNVIHLIRGSSDCRYRSYIIPEKMLGFFPGSAMEQTYVFPVTRNPCFTHLRLTPSDKTHAHVLEALSMLDQAYMDFQSHPCPEYHICVRLASLWQQFYVCLPELPKKTDGFLRDLERIQLLLTHIHQHYASPLSLAEIAAAAHISKSECQRTFLQFTRTSPYRYLMDYRLRTAATQLKQTQNTVSSIALDCGFASVSSFAQYFKKRYGMTPSQYRDCGDGAK